jgi:hypothetical protein
VIVCRAGSRIDVEAESKWPSGSCLEFWATDGCHRPPAGLRQADRGE